MGNLTLVSNCVIFITVNTAYCHIRNMIVVLFRNNALSIQMMVRSSPIDVSQGIPWRPTQDEPRSWWKKKNKALFQFSSYRRVNMTMCFGFVLICTCFHVYFDIVSESMSPKVPLKMSEKKKVLVKS